MVAYEVDSIEFASCRADTASYALVGINYGCAASEAAGCFGFDLLFCEDQTVVLETVFIVNSLINRRNLTLSCIIGIDRDVVFVEGFEITAVSCESL